MASILRCTARRFSESQGAVECKTVAGRADGAISEQRLGRAPRPIRREASAYAGASHLSRRCRLKPSKSINELCDIREGGLKWLLPQTAVEHMACSSITSDVHYLRPNCAFVEVTKTLWLANK